MLVNDLSTTEKNAAASLAILMAMRITRYGAERIAQYDRSRDTLDATVLRHRAIIHPVSPQRTPWPLILSKKNRVVAL